MDWHLYHALWIATALALVALASGVIAHRLRCGDLHRAKAEEALDALARSSEWLARQRRNPGFQGEGPDGHLPLAQLRALQEAYFPDLADALVALLDVHGRVLDFLWAQQLLRTNDLEAWLVSDHDARFMALWRDHRAAVHAMAERLRERAGEGMLDPEPESVFPA